MPASAKDIWRVPVYLPYLQPDLSDAAVTEAEKLIGHPLPRAYLDLLRVQNGGYIRYRLGDTVHDVICGIGPQFPSIGIYLKNPHPDGLVPFDGDGLWLLCFDFREQDADPPITLIDFELNEQSKVADSFTEYLSKLRLDITENFVLPAIGDIEPVKTVLAKSAALRFEPPSAWEHGYEVHGAPDPNDQFEWLWLSPNTVPRGFVREEDSRYAELKDRMPGVTARYPGLPAGSWLVKVTEALQTPVLEALADARIDVRPLSDFVADAGAT